MNLREKAYESFRQHLLKKSFRPGQFISQRELVALTGLPLGAIREMIPRLEADGLIVTIPQRGMQIATVDLKLVRTAFQLRAMLEREAVANFARAAGDGEIAALVRLHAGILRRAERGEVGKQLLDEAQMMDWGFHDAIIERLDNELVTAIYRVNSLRVRLIKLEQSLLSADSLLPALREHGVILAALEARDVAAAVEAMDRHIASARLRAMGIADRPESPLRPAGGRVQRRTGTG